LNGHSCSKNKVGVNVSINEKSFVNCSHFVILPGTAPLARIIHALEKAKSLPFLHSPVVSAANAYKEVPPPAVPKNANSRGAVPARVPSATAKSNSTAPKQPAPAKRPVVPAHAPPAHAPPSRTGLSSANKSAPSSVKPSPARPPATTAPANRARPAASSTTAKHAAPANKSASSTNNKKTVAHEAPIQKTIVNPVKGAAMSRATAAIGKAAASVVGKTSGTVPPKGVPSKTNRSAPPAPAAPAPVPAEEEVKEPAPTPVEPMPQLDDSVVILDDVVPDICVDAPQDPASSDLRPTVELVVIPPTPEPRSPSGRSSIDGPLSPAFVRNPDGDKPPIEQHVLPSDDGKQIPSPDPKAPAEHEHHEIPSPTAHEDHDSHADHKDSPKPAGEHDPQGDHKDASKPAPPSPQIETSGPAFPTSPAGPAAPSSPSGPAAPSSPSGPAVPSSPSGPAAPSSSPDPAGLSALTGATEPTIPGAPTDSFEPLKPSVPEDKHEPTEPPAPGDKSGSSERPEPSESPAGDDKSEASQPAADDDKHEPAVPSAPPLPMPAPIPSDIPGSITEPGADPHLIEIPKADDDKVGPASPSEPKHEHDDSPSIPPVHVDVTPAEPFPPPSFDKHGQASPSDLLIEDDIPDEFKGPHTPQEVGENGLLDDLEEPPKLKKISMDTDDLEKALQKGAAAVADQLAHCLDSLSLSADNSEKDDSEKMDSHDDESSKKEAHDQVELARKLSQQMVEEASTPLASALASALADGAGAVQTAVGSAYEGLVDLATTVSESVTEGVKDAAELAQEKMKTMQTRSSLVESDGDNRPVKYEETDPVIDSVLETVATDSDRVDHALSNGGSGLENKENGRRPDHEVDDDGFRLASADHDIRLHLPPLTAARGNRAVAVPHLSRPLFFELVTVPHLHGKCTLTDEQSAVEYFTNIRSANYILHSEDVSPVVLDGWLTGKKQWFRDDQKCRLIPTRHHSALLAFVTAHAAEMEEHGLVVNSSLEHNSISINTEEGREDYHMIKIEL
ncbi:hypothetical protein COOONC_10407, partial [Cooperia oncophora]